jgi:hypothetical protein
MLAIRRFTALMEVDAIAEAGRNMHSRYLDLLTVALRSDIATNKEVTPAELIKLLEIISSTDNVSPEQQTAAWLEYALRVRD